MSSFETGAFPISRHILRICTTCWWACFASYPNPLTSISQVLKRVRVISSVLGGLLMNFGDSQVMANLGGGVGGAGLVSKSKIMKISKVTKMYDHT